MKSRIVKIILVLAIGWYMAFGATGYVIFSPGTVERLDARIEVESGTKDAEGTFSLVTVLQRHATPFLLLRSSFSPVNDVQRLSAVLPPDMSMEEYEELMLEWMMESQNLAKVVALRHFGYDVEVTSDGVEVVDFLSDSPAQGKLQVTDIIKKVDGEPVYLAEEVTAKVMDRAVGEPVTLHILRQGEEKEITINTISRGDELNRAAIGVFIRTLNWEPRLPLQVSIEVGDIAGPSAGLVFVLEILNQLDPADITAGRQIAGTGTVMLDGRVGEVGGVKQKVRAAEEAGADFFLVPHGNLAEAQMLSPALEIVPVSNLAEAVEFLTSLETN